jgi:hypothetical protein
MRYVRLVAFYALVFICTAFTLFQLFDWDIDMRSVMSFVSLLCVPFVTSQNSTVDLGWHAPKKSWINDLEEVLNGTGTNGFLFNGSQLPAGTPYGTYNWCNMPRVRAQEYPKAIKEFELVYVEVYVFPNIRLLKYLLMRTAFIAIIKEHLTHPIRFPKNHTDGIAMTKASSTTASR